ncbi:MAG: glycosyl hydrolase family 28 protein [Bacteroidota bacterium]|nr:glycosyl hydrolase family 28 protein [Bacteroidota bacterium]
MNKSHSRREFLKTTGKGFIIIPAGMAIAGKLLAAENNNGVSSGNKEKKDDDILRLNVRDFGAAGDGKTKDTLAIQQTIDRCWVLGGGEVIVPAGNYFTGAIALRSNTLLRLDKEAVLTGTPDFEDYPVMQVRWEGKWTKGHAGLIYALQADNTGIVGPGHITGNPALGGRPNDKYPLRHPALIEPIGCNHLRFEDFSTDYHLMWSMHPVYCENIIIKNLTIRSTGGNGDGIDIDSCKHVLIDGCDIATGDDCISLKSGRGMEGYTLLKTTEDVRITNCVFADSIFACIGIGSETSGGIRNVRIEHCKFTAAKTYAIYIKSRPGRGAFIEDIACNDLDISGMQGGFLRFNILGSGLQDPDPVPGIEGIPGIKNFSFTHIRVKDVPVLVEGNAVHPAKPLNGFVFTDVSGTCAKGISLANIKDAVFKNITVTGYTGPLLSINNVTGKGLEGAVFMDAPKIPDPIPAPEKKYQLH